MCAAASLRAPTAAGYRTPTADPGRQGGAQRGKATSAGPQSRVASLSQRRSRNRRRSGIVSEVHACACSTPSPRPPAAAGFRRRPAALARRGSRSWTGRPPASGPQCRDHVLLVPAPRHRALGPARDREAHDQQGALRSVPTVHGRLQCKPQPNQRVGRGARLDGEVAATPGEVCRPALLARSRPPLATCACRNTPPEREAGRPRILHDARCCADGFLGGEWRPPMRHGCAEGCERSRRPLPLWRQRWLRCHRCPASAGISDWQGRRAAATGRRCSPPETAGNWPRCRPGPQPGCYDRSPSGRGSL